MTDAQWVGLFFALLVLLLPVSLGLTILRRRRGHPGANLPEHVTDRVGFDTLADVERNRSANRT